MGSSISGFLGRFSTGLYWCAQLLVALASTLLACPASKAQADIMVCSDSTYCVPQIIGLPRSKGFSVTNEWVRDYSIKSSSQSEEIGDGSAEVSRNRRWEIKGRLPILNKDGIKVAAGLSYFVEEYRFEDANELDHPFYLSLEDKSLKSFGGQVFVVKPFLGNKYVVFRASARLNGDYGPSDQPNTEFLKYSASAIWGVKENPRTTWGLGAAYTYTFGRASIYPVFTYYHSFNEKWGIETLLPAFAKLRWSPTEQNFFYLTTELNGANYNIHLDELGGNAQPVFLEKSEIRYTVTYNREVYDFLWAGVTAGMRTNLQFDLMSDYQLRRSSRVLNNTLNHAMLINFSIFVVPPRRFVE